MEEPSELIPTRYKSKLSSLLSWPIGAEELSAGLKGVPQFAELETTFYFNGLNDIRQARTTTWMSLIEFRYNRLESGLCDPKKAAESGVLERHWPIRVHPVLRENRKKLHDGILLQLPRVATWLIERHGLDVVGESSMQIVWNAREDEVYVSSQDALEPLRARKA